ncbi:MAG: ABC transporter permease [Acidimicrobiia bacterium]|nr:ABC transporter permease [Acidimicrobiia bacterium]
MWRLRGDIPHGLRLALSAVGLATPIAVWWVVATVSASALIPTPVDTWAAVVELQRGGDLWSDFLASSRRIALGYGISVSIGVVAGVLIGSYRSLEAFAEPQIGFLRYIPATALLPLFLFWLGIDEAPKIALIVVGTVFFNTLMIADVARGTPRELISAAYTLGAGRLKVLRRVILPHSLPGMIDVARINLAAAWLMLVVAELLAAQDGLAFRIVRAQRFRQVDRMFALLLILGLIGVLSDMALRWLRNRSSPWARP